MSSRPPDAADASAGSSQPPPSGSHYVSRLYAFRAVMPACPPAGISVYFRSLSAKNPQVSAFTSSQVHDRKPTQVPGQARFVARLPRWLVGVCNERSLCRASCVVRAGLVTRSNCAAACSAPSCTWIARSAVRLLADIRDRRDRGLGPNRARPTAGAGADGQKPETGANVRNFSMSTRSS
jgi:hypothetical protein